MKLILKMIAVVMVLIVDFGFIAPSLISSNSNELVIMGIISTFAAIGISVFILISAIKNIPEEKKSIQKFFVDFKNKITKE